MAEYHAKYLRCPICRVPHADEIDDMLLGKVRTPSGEAWTMDKISDWYEPLYGITLYTSQISRHKKNHLQPELDKVSQLKKQVDHMFAGKTKGEDGVNLEQLKKAFIKKSIMLLLSVMEDEVHHMSVEDRFTYALRFSNLAMDIDNKGSTEILQQFKKLVDEVSATKANMTRQAADVIDSHMNELMGVGTNGKIPTVPLPATVDGGSEPIQHVDGLPPDSREIVVNNPEQRHGRTKAKN
jgi:hypothetical protein